MKRQYIYILLSVLFLVTSCDKYLDTAPDNRTEIDTKEKIAQLIASAYPQACYAAMLDSRVDYVTDKGTGQINNSNVDPFYWRDVEETSQDTPDYFWGRCYYSIAEVNHALYDTINFSATDIQDIRPYIGEAYMIRSFSHFLVASLFSNYFDTANENKNPGVPYVTEKENVVIKQYDRSTVAKTKELIEQDLLKGFEDIGSDAVYKVPRYHFNYKAACAFASRFYLYEGEWQKVINYVNNVFPMPSLLTADGNIDKNDAANVYAANNFQPWCGQYVSVPSSNDIKAYYTSGSNPSNLLLTEMSSRLARYANTWRYGVDGKNIKYIYDNNVAGTKLGFRTYSSSSTHYYVPKFREHFVKTSINATTGTIYTIFPYFRNEELLLNRAEAYVMLGMYEQAINDLNVYVRNRIKPASYNEKSNVLTVEKILDYYLESCNNPDNFMNKYNAYDSQSWENEKKALIMCILDFRNMEFKWEGLRYWDMIRYKMSVTHVDFAGNENTLYPGDDRWILQIPESAALSGVEPNPRENLLSREW